MSMDAAFDALLQDLRKLVEDQVVLNAQGVATSPLSGRRIGRRDRKLDPASNC